MEVVSVLRMNGGEGEKSYARNSYIQMRALIKAKHIKEEAICKLYQSMDRQTNEMNIADLGCSSAADQLWSVIYNLIRTVDVIRQKLGEDDSPPNFNVYLNDLPGNDFNTILKSVPRFQDMVKKQLKETYNVLVNVVPGSFHRRIFQSQSLHFVHSSFAIHWLSRVPEGIERSNKGNIYISKNSPTSVSNAYYYQFVSNFITFLRCRSEEIVDGGWMVFTVVGRRGKDKSSKDCCYMWDLLAMALRQMVSEGLIQEEKMNDFNIPVYYPSPMEIEYLVKEVGSFTIHRLEVSEVDWNPTSSTHDMYNHKVKEIQNIQYNYDFDENNNRRSLGQTKTENHVDFVRCMRAVIEPLLVAHFGDAIIEDIFNRYNLIVVDRMIKERNFFIPITVSLCKNPEQGEP